MDGVILLSTKAKNALTVNMQYLLQNTHLKILSDTVEKPLITANNVVDTES